MKNNVVAIRHRQKDGNADSLVTPEMRRQIRELKRELDQYDNCLLYTSPSPRDGLLSRMPSSA